MEKMIVQPQSADQTVASGEGAELRKRAIAVGIGNFMEWFDFAIYGYFAAVIGQIFSPPQRQAFRCCRRWRCSPWGFFLGHWGPSYWGRSVTNLAGVRY